MRSLTAPRLEALVWPVACALVMLGSTAHAQQTRTTHVAGNVHMITGAGGNVTVSAGDNGVLVVDTGAAGMSDALLAAIRGISEGPIRYIINTGISPQYIGGNEAIRAAGETFTGGNAPVVAGVGEGAAVVGHENLLLRMVSLPEVSFDALPTEPFFIERTDLYFNGEPVEIIYQPNAADDTNVIVHFRRSDVISTGEVFRLDRYPFIDVDNGGSIDGTLSALNALVQLAIADTLSEGGTLLVPGRGRISDEGDLVRYRDMVTIVRDRIQAWMDRGYGLEEIKARQPSLEYDSRYGADAGWTTEMFVEAVYRSLGGETASGETRSAAQ